MHLYIMGRAEKATKDLVFQALMLKGPVAYQPPLSMGFSKQEYWSGLPFPSPEDSSDPGIKPGSPALKADYLPSEPPYYTVTIKQT